MTLRIDYHTPGTGDDLPVSNPVQPGSRRELGRSQSDIQL
jgi:hypothetical protein